MKIKNRKVIKYDTKKEEKQNLIVNFTKLSGLILLASFFNFIFSLFKREEKQKNREEIKVNIESKENNDINENNKDDTKKENIENDIKKENIKEDIKKQNKEKEQIPKIENQEKLKQEETKIISVSKNEKEEFDIAKKVVMINKLENKKLEKKNTTLNNLKIINRSLKYFTLADLLFKHNQINTLVKSINLNNALRSIRRKRQLDLKKTKYNKKLLNKLNRKITIDTNHQINMCKLEIKDINILNEILYLENTLNSKTEIKGKAYRK